MKSAKNRNGKAMRNIGMCFEKGMGVPKDMCKAYEWYLKVANSGDAGGMQCVGLCYWDGKGVAQDKAKAYEWYLKAAKKNVEAMNSVGQCYQRGEGTPQSAKKGSVLVQKGNGQGSCSSHFQHGSVFEGWLWCCC